MKKLILLPILMLMPLCAHAGVVYISSNTATADTAKSLCGTDRKAILHNVSVNTGAAGTLTLYNSRASATNAIAAINTAAVYNPNFDVQLSSGLTYTNSATANVTINYACY